MKRKEAQKMEERLTVVKLGRCKAEEDGGKGVVREQNERGVRRRMERITRTWRLDRKSLRALQRSVGVK